MSSISEVAARWAVRTDAGPLDPDEARELEAWLSEDPRHRGAYVRARARWMDLDRLAAQNGRASSDARADSAEPTVNVIVRRRRTTEGGLSRRQVLAATVAAFAIAGGCLSWMISHDRRELYSSGVGEVRRIALADGSTMLLNTDSEVTVKWAKGLRDIRLVRGEALFEVAHDKSRPFIVAAGDTAVRAVGTAFAVRLEVAQIDVTVTEGLVEVADVKALAAPDPVTPPTLRSVVSRVAANERVVIARATRRVTTVERISSAEAERQLAWRDGLVSFDGESLQTAVTEMNRYNHLQIVIAAPALAQRPLVGVFRATDPAGFSAAAAAALKARAVRDGDVIRLEPPAAARPN